MTDRTLLHRSRTLLGTDATFVTADGIDVDSSQNYEVIRRRVFFDDVALVTLHRERGLAFLLTTGAFGTFFLAMAIFVVAINVEAWEVALPFFILGAPAFLAFLLRLAMGRAVVTVWGRRSRAVLRFGVFRSGKARRVYGKICSAVRRAQSGAAGFSPPESPARPLPADVPLPPPAQ
ncbi:MAG TPA: hypothetical protein VEO54_28745 [Thermoanaerobaculia bacterium]|nr:hypothetical protein [Thermoanaerobaculia bacterium]